MGRPQPDFRKPVSTEHVLYRLVALVADTLHVSTVDATLLVGLVPLILAGIGGMMHVAARLSEVRAGLRYLEGRMDGISDQVERLELHLSNIERREGK